MSTGTLKENMMEFQLLVLQTLYEIVMESDEPEIIRKALAALTATAEGRQYLEMNPITV